MAAHPGRRLTARSGNDPAGPVVDAAVVDHRARPFRRATAPPRCLHHATPPPRHAAPPPRRPALPPRRPAAPPSPPQPQLQATTAPATQRPGP
ncbi:hypothetical protein EKG83_22705 [Saccharothrix syringae]|uniref:Uncharacterized protein n=1 Tax=Saccharothrix syringae TaxID=103733 RepID=A0A5Q0H1X5_SACSY|nr:hypothetical protein EKG83_22705 [Saccharothrix syringae]